MSSLGPFAINAYLPGFHEIALEFGTSLAAIQQTMTLYLISFALASLFTGVLSDSYGRKPVLLGGMLLFAAASLGAALSTDIFSLSVWRFIQGIGASVGQVVTQACVRDRWSGLPATRLTGMIGMFFALSPILAPVIGGNLIVHFGWRSSFLFLIAYSLSIAFIIVVGLKESLARENRQPLRLSLVLSSYAKGLGCGALVAGALMHGILFAGAIVYSCGGADFVITIMGFGIDEFAWFTVPIVGAGCLGSWCSTRIRTALSIKNLLWVELALLTVVSFATVFAQQRYAWTYPMILAGPVAYQFLMSLLRPAVMVMNLDYFPSNRGMAASIQQFCTTGGFALCSMVFVPFALGDAVRYAIVMSGCALTCCLLWAVSMRLRAQALSGRKDEF
jgi:DHA1 family bicyclomycin/chloramphenicol resistance-like MFS transporter